MKTDTHSQLSTLNSPFKQTEAGVIPEDWDDLPLEEITKEDAPICYGIVQVGSYIPNGIPVLAIKNLNSDYVANIHRASVEVERPYTRSRIRPEDVLVSVKGTTGRVGIVPFGFHGNISRDLARLRLREGIVPRFVLHMLQSDLAQRRLATAVVGTTRMELSIAILKKVRIPLPPTKAEQEAIAEALSDVYALIESLEQLIAKKRQIKQGAMQELLTGKKRLPGFRGEWEKIQLGSVVERIVGGGTPSRAIDSYWNGDIPWMTVKDFAQHSPFGTLEYITKEGLKNSASNLIPKRTLITSTRMALGKVVIFEVDVSINQDLKALFPTKDTDTLYLYYWFQFNEARIVEMGSGSTVMGISLGDLRKIPFSKPPLPEQTTIAALLSDMDAEIAALEEKLAKARQIKQGMMHNLLTGKIRLVGATGRSPLQTHLKSR